MQHKMQEIRLVELIRQVATGGMALPEFQRDFVWDPSRVIELLDSVSNGWPIGSLLLLEGPQPFRIKPLEGGPPVEPQGVNYFLLDGQQRATSLFHAATDTGDVTYFIDVRDEMDELGVPPIRWTRKKKGRATLPSATAYTLATLIDERRFRNLAYDLPSQDVVWLEQVREKRLGYLLRNQYSLPTIVMSENIELEALTRIFETLNRTGVRLDAFDLMVAALYSETFHLRDEWKAARDLYPQLVSMKTNGVEILKLIALWARRRYREQNDETLRRVTGVRQRDVLNIPSEFVRTRWDDAVKAYAEALAFLSSRLGVTQGKANPSEAMTLTLAYHLAAGRSPAELERWYWRSVIKQAYAQGANTQVLSDVDTFELSREQDEVALAAQLQLALFDQNRRNRILRLGIRGFLLRDGARDPLTEMPLTEDIESVSLSAVLDDSETYTVGDSLVVDMILCQPSTAIELRKAARSNSSIPPLSAPALRSQSFPEATLEMPPDQWRTQRATELEARMGGVL